MDSIKHLQIRQKQRVTNFDIRPFCSVAIGYKRSFEAHLTTSIHGNPPDAVSTWTQDRRIEDGESSNVSPAYHCLRLGLVETHETRAQI